MKLSTLLAGLVMSGVAAFAHAQESGILLSMQIEKDGAVFVKPRLVTKSGVQATVQQDQDIKLEVTPIDKDGDVDLSMRLYLPGKDGLAVAASPHLVTKLDTPTTIEFQAADTTRYTIRLTASSHPIGAPLPPAK
jgi:hypothetical protein